MNRVLILVLLTALPLSAQSGAPPQKSAKPDLLMSEQYSDAVADVLLSRLAQGFVRRNPKLLLSAFDPKNFTGYSQFADRMRARLGQQDAFRAYFRILDRAPQDSRATVEVELQIEQDYTDSARPSSRSAGQARFTLERTAAGWRIVDVKPRHLLTGVPGPA